MDERDMSGQPVSELPNEVVLKMMQYLSGAIDLLIVGGVCRQWRLVSGQNTLWEPFCKHMTALTQEQQQTCDQTGGYYKALYIAWRQKWCSAGETQCEHVQLECKWLPSESPFEIVVYYPGCRPRRGSSELFRGQCLAVTHKYIFGCSEDNKDRLIMWSTWLRDDSVIEMGDVFISDIFISLVLVSSDEKRVVLVTGDSKIAQVFDVGSRSKVYDLRHPKIIDKIWIHKNYLMVNTKRLTFVWDIATGVRLYWWHALAQSGSEDAVVVCDGNLALVCHMQLDQSGTPSNTGSPLLNVYDLTTGENIVSQYLGSSPVSTTHALSEKRSMFACIYKSDIVGVQKFGDDIINRVFVQNAGYICIQGDYLLVAGIRKLLVFNLSQIKLFVLGDVYSTEHIPHSGSGFVGVIVGPSHMHSRQSMYPLWCGLVVTVSVDAVNLWDIVNMRFIKTLVKLHDGQTIENIHISDHKVKCIVSDPQLNIKCIQLNVCTKLSS